MITLISRQAVILYILLHLQTAVGYDYKTDLQQHDSQKGQQK